MSIDRVIGLNPVFSEPDTPPVGSGKVYFYLQGSSLKYKDDTGAVSVVATGVTSEEVEDIIGSFIQSSNNRITILYDDFSDVLELTLEEANIIHDNISGAGVNTHSQIDSHIGSTSNPHSVTPSQIGAYSTGQTDTLLSAKYDESNPLGFEGSLQLDARDSANRSRDNHTGFQLSETISDFSSSVISTVISGFVVGASIIVSSADTIIQALGKLQGQINNINSIISTIVIGDQFEDFSDNTPFSTTSNANQVAASFTTASKPPGRYRVAMNWRWGISAGTSDAIFGLYIDGVLQGNEHNMELQDATTNQWFYQISYLNLVSGVHTIELRTRAENTGSTITVSNVVVELWRAN